MRRVSGGTVRAAALLLALLGLLAMHGLADHGAAGHHAGGTGEPGATAAAHAAHGEHDVTARLGAAYDAVTAAVPLGDPGPGSDPGHAGAALCLAVLLLGLALLVGDRRGLRVLRRASPAHLGATRLPDARDPDPPDLSRLCVLRC